MHKPPEEYELARRAKDGDQGALGELANRTRVRLFAQAYADLRHYEDAQDAVAAALVQICLHVQDVRDPTSIWPWMRSIVRNETRRLRRGTLEPPASLDGLDPAAPDEDLELKFDVDRALARLPADQARALSLFYLNNLPIKEIASITRRPEGTIKTWLRRGRQSLAISLKEYGPMPSTLRATIISSEIAADELKSITDAIRSAGYGDISVVSDPTLVIKIQSTAEHQREIAMLPPLKQSQLVVLDDRAGGHSAFEVMQMLKSDESMAAIPTVMLASRPSDIKTLCAWQAGFDLYLNRPVDPAELTNLIGRLPKE